MNTLKTTLLLAALTALFMSLGLMIGGPRGAVLALLVAAVMNLVTYWNADKIVLRMHGAREVGPEHDLHRITRGLATRAGMPMPKVHVIDSPHPNAFATGRNPGNAAVAATTGLLALLDRREVAGVMAHELAHIRHHDTLVMTMVATIAGAISMIGNFALFFRSGDRGGMLATLAAVIVAPFAAMIVQMAISRHREYGADRGGAEISGDPRALASALGKLAEGAGRVPNPVLARNPAAAQLYIVPALSGGGRDGLFSTHPDTGNRIAALEALAAEMGAPPVTIAGEARRSALDPVARPRRVGSALDPLKHR